LVLPGVSGLYALTGFKGGLISAEKAERRRS